MPGDRASPTMSDFGTSCSSSSSSSSSSLSLMSTLVPNHKDGMSDNDERDNTRSRCSSSMIAVVGETGGRRLEGCRINRDRSTRRDRRRALRSHHRTTWCTATNTSPSSSSSDIYLLDHQPIDAHSVSSQENPMSYPPPHHPSNIHPNPYPSTWSPNQQPVLTRDLGLPLPRHQARARYDNLDSHFQSRYQAVDAEEQGYSGSGAGSGSRSGLRYDQGQAGPRFIPSPRLSADRPRTLESWAEDLSRSELAEFERLGRLERGSAGAGGDGNEEWVGMVFGRGWDERVGFPQAGEVDRVQDPLRPRPRPLPVEEFPYVPIGSRMDFVTPRPSTSASTSTSVSTLALSNTNRRISSTPQSRPLDIRSTVNQPIRQLGFEMDDEMYFSPPPALRRSKPNPSPASSSSIMMGPPEGHGRSMSTSITPAGGDRRLSLASTSSPGMRSLEKIGLVSLAAGGSSSLPLVMSTSASGMTSGSREMSGIASGSGSVHASGGGKGGVISGSSFSGLSGASGLPRSMVGAGGEAEGGSGSGGEKGKQGGAGGKATKKKAAKACLQCQKAHLTCDDSRPCSRCVKKGQGDQCCEGQRKKAKYLMTEAELAEHNAKKRARARKPKPVESAEQDAAKPSIRSVEDSGSPLQALNRMDPEDDGMAGQADDANDQAMDDVAYGNDMSLGQGFQFDSQAANLEYAVLDSIFSDLPGLAEQNGVESFMNAWQGAAMGSQSLIGGSGSGQNQLGQDMMDFSMQSGELATGAPAPTDVRSQNPVANDLRAMAIGSVGTQDSASSVYDSVSEPYDYTVSYHQLMRHLAKNFDQKSILRVVKSLAAFRPSLIALLMPLSFEDEVFLEKSFQRTLIELEKLISYSGTPTAVWRRTGEICVVGDEFVKLTGWSRGELLGSNGGKRKFWFELLDRASTVDYYAKFSQHAFENTAQNFYMPVVIKHGGETSGTATPARELKCAASFTIRRDVFDLPCAVIGQLLPATG